MTSDWGALWSRLEGDGLTAWVRGAPGHGGRAWKGKRRVNRALEGLVVDTDQHA